MLGSLIRSWTSLRFRNDLRLLLRSHPIDFSIEEAIRVPIETVADHVAERSIDRIDLLKLDVQGFEAAAAPR